jgi:hypothetical protein
LPLECPTSSFGSCTAILSAILTPCFTESALYTHLRFGKRLFRIGCSHIPQRNCVFDPLLKQVLIGLRQLRSLHERGTLSRGQF